MKRLYAWQDTSGVATVGPYVATAERPQLVGVLVFAAIFTYLWQRTYPPGS